MHDHQQCSERSRSEIVYLMYHELEMPRRKPYNAEPGYMRYVLRMSDFVEQMKNLQGAGWRGRSVGEALEVASQKTVVITFDDGCETDLLAAAPVLQLLKFGATFYTTCDWVGRRSFLSRQQLRELSDLGFEIGSHSMSHVYLPDVNDAELRHEVADSKSWLEDVIGLPVKHFSCPGGRFDHRVKKAVETAGYSSLATSRPRANARATDVYELGRAAVVRNTSIQQFEALYKGVGLWKMNLRAGVNQSAKRILGNTFYDRLRSAVLS